MTGPIYVQGIGVSLQQLKADYVGASEVANERRDVLALVSALESCYDGAELLKEQWRLLLKQQEKALSDRETLLQIAYDLYRDEWEVSREDFDQWLVGEVEARRNQPDDSFSSAVGGPGGRSGHQTTQGTGVVTQVRDRSPMVVEPDPGPLDLEEELWPRETWETERWKVVFWILLLGLYLGIVIPVAIWLA